MKYTYKNSFTQHRPSVKAVHGFTTIEIIIVVSIFAIVGIAIGTTFNRYLQAERAVRQQESVDKDLINLVQTIKQRLHSAEIVYGIDDPVGSANCFETTGPPPGPYFPTYPSGVVSYERLYAASGSGLIGVIFYTTSKACSVIVFDGSSNIFEINAIGGAKKLNSNNIFITNFDVTVYEEQYTDTSPIVDITIQARPRSDPTAKLTTAQFTVGEGIRQVVGICTPSSAETQYHPGTPLGGQLFGSSVAFSNNTMLIGAEGDNGGQGAVYVFKEIAGSYVQTQKLTVPATTGFFGKNMAVDGNKLIVSGNLDWPYIYDYNGTDWVDDEQLPAQPINNALTGLSTLSVDIKGNRAIVGARHETIPPGTGFDGAVFIFEDQSGTWVLLEKIAPFESGDQSYFGDRVAIDGNTAIVTCLGIFGSECAKGTYVYKESGGAWTPETQILTFGQDVELTTTQLIIGNDASTPGLDDVLVYDDSGGIYVPAPPIPPPALSENFGRRVSVSGNSLLVGAPGTGGLDEGTAYLYGYNGTDWIFSDTLIPSDSTAGQRFGWAVSIDGDKALVGSRNDTDNGVDSGTLYYYGVNVCS